MACTIVHSLKLDEERLKSLDSHQKHGYGRHQCCQCAYNQGYNYGIVLSDNLRLDIEQLPETQAERDGRHKSVHQAFALGYADGVSDLINQ